MRKRVWGLMAAAAFVWMPEAARAQIKPDSGKIKGYMINEFYSVLSHHDENIDGQNGFWFRRIYFTYDNTLSDTIKMRLRLEMNSPGDYVSSSSLDPYVKDAYLSARIGGQNLIAGIQSPPSFNQIEAVWGYRPLEKTPLDLMKWTSSRDFGISLTGGDRFPYHIMFANGSSNKSETNRGKKFFGALGYKKNGFFVEAMAQYERAKTHIDDVIFQGFASYTGNWGRIGIQYANRSYTVGDAGSLKYNIASAFAVIKAGENMEVVARYDANFGDGYKSSYKGSGIAYIPFADNVESNLFIGALSWQAARNVWIIPNVKYVFYGDPSTGEKPGEDAYGNLTLYFKF